MTWMMRQFMDGIGEGQKKHVPISDEKENKRKDN